MSMIFPGMDPYLEDPQLHPGFHNSLVVYAADHLQPVLGSRYIAALEERVFVEDAKGATRSNSPGGPQLPALEIHESYIEILDRKSGMNVVTVIEVVSPANKFAGPGRESYLEKQREVRSSQTHLVEIDLLRTGQHVLAVLEWVVRGKQPYDYLVCVNRAEGLRDLFALYPRLLPQRLPRIAIPLAGDDPEVALDLQAVLEQTYERGRYRERLDYDAPCTPPLDPNDQAWADEQIRGARAG